MALITAFYTLATFGIGCIAPPQQEAALPPKYILGVTVTDIIYSEPQLAGNIDAVKIESVLPDTPANQLGLEPGDIITRVNGNRVRNKQEFINSIQSSNGTIWFRLRDVRTGQYRDALNVRLQRQPSQEKDRIADTIKALRERIKEKGFDSNLLKRSHPVGEIDPLIVEANWDLIRTDLEESIAAIVGREDPVSFPLLIAQTVRDGGKKWVSYKIPTENEIARAILKDVLDLDDSYFIVARAVAETLTFPIRSLLPKYRLGGNDVDFAAIEHAIEEMIQTDDNILKPMNLSAKPFRNPKLDRLDVISNWVYSCQVDAIRYYWRINVRIIKDNQRQWTLVSTIDLGKRSAAMAAPRWFASTDTNRDIAKNLKVRVQGGGFHHAEPVMVWLTEERGVQQLEAPVASSNLAETAKQVFNLSREKLTGPDK